MKLITLLNIFSIVTVAIAVPTIEVTKARVGGSSTNIGCGANYGGVVSCCNTEQNDSDGGLLGLGNILSPTGCSSLSISNIIPVLSINVLNELQDLLNDQCGGSGNAVCCPSESTTGPTNCGSSLICPQILNDDDILSCSPIGL